jgi:hypothetical protein
MTTRRNFIKNTGLGVAAISMTGFAQCTSNQTKKGVGPFGGKVIDAHIHVTPDKVKNALQVMDDNAIRYAVIIASFSQRGDEWYSGDRAFYEIIEAINPTLTGWGFTIPMTGSWQKRIRISS